MRLRAPVPDDAPAVLAVLVARDIADFGTPDFTLEDLRDEWRASAFDLSADAVVVEAGDGRIVGYAAARQPGTLAVVAPDDEGRGIGVRLRHWAERRDLELGRERHRQWIASSNARGQALLRAAGYRPVRSYWRMVRRLDDVADAGTAPNGFDLRPLDVDSDAAALHALDAVSFAANPDYEPESLQAFCEEHLQVHDLDVGLSCVAEHRGNVVGFLLARRWREQDDSSAVPGGEAGCLAGSRLEPVGYVDILAVHPEHQRRGLATTLLRTAFVRFAGAGLREAQLGVASDNPRALRLYERVGMKARFQVDVYERPSLVASTDVP